MAETVVLNWLVGAMVAQSAYQAKRQRDYNVKAEKKADAAKKEAEQREQADARLREQGKSKEQATELRSKDAYADTGGIPLSIKKRLSIGGETGTNY